MAQAEGHTDHNNLFLDVLEAGESKFKGLPESIFDEGLWFRDNGFLLCSHRLTGGNISLGSFL